MKYQYNKLPTFYYNFYMNKSIKRFKGFGTHRIMVYCLVFYLVLVVSPKNSLAQFISGSTGADGPFNPTSTTILQVPESGIFNFTTVNIPSNVNIGFIKNSRNTPIYILATGDVVIRGNIYVNGRNSNGQLGGDSGPGGFNGGDGGNGTTTSSEINNGLPGEGPGGGIGGGNGTNQYGRGGCGGFATAGGAYQPTPPNVDGPSGSKYGIKTLSTLIGGSGGGGSSSSSQGIRLPGEGGGGGGGAILIASSSSITFQPDPGTWAIISALGGVGNNSGAGAAGAIRLVANTISGKVEPQIYARNNGGSGCFGGAGYLRIEAYNITDLQLSPSVNYGIISRANPQPVFPINAPKLRILSIGGINIPSQPRGTFQDNPDINIPLNQKNPVTVVVEGINIPSGTVVKILLTPEIGDRVTVQTSPLIGKAETTTSSANINIPNGISLIQASAVIDLTGSNQGLFINGEKVKKVEVLSDINSNSTTVIYTFYSGKTVKSP